FVEKLVARAGTHWNKFYSNHAKNPATNQFFKDRHWTDREWPQLAQLAEPVVPKGKGKAVLEVGCGTGAFIYPLLERYPQARYVAFDFAKKAVELTKNHPLYNPSSCHIFQHDLTLPLSALSEKLASPPPEFGDPILPGSFDIVSCVFVLSALPPHKQAGAIQTLVSLLAPGGWLLFRDYALRDAAQLRFHSLPSASYATEPSLLS
ncbi:S-adenosyl-L-methionine-dependent methyltransferase, partial [Rhodotorula sp. JG-1b]